MLKHPVMGFKLAFYVVYTALLNGSCFIALYHTGWCELWIPFGSFKVSIESKRWVSKTI